MSAPPKRTVLQIEDNLANMQLVEDCLSQRTDLQLISARNARLGIEMARTYLPDVILMDMVMPEIGGLAALRELRADPMTAHIPVIALSSDAFPRHIKLAMDAGFFHYMTKPIRLTNFLSAIDAALDFDPGNSIKGAQQSRSPR